MARGKKDISIRNTVRVTCWNCGRSWETGACHLQVTGKKSDWRCDDICECLDRGRYNEGKGRAYPHRKFGSPMVKTVAREPWKPSGVAILATRDALRNIAYHTHKILECVEVAQIAMSPPTTLIAPAPTTPVEQPEKAGVERKGEVV